MYRERHPLEGPLLALLLFNQIFAMIGFYATIQFFDDRASENVPTGSPIAIVVNAP